MYEMGRNWKTPACLNGVASYLPSYGNTACYDTAIFSDVFYDNDWIKKNKTLDKFNIRTVR